VELAQYFREAKGELSAELKLSFQRS